MKTILITGGSGFIGGNFLNYFHKKYPSYRLVNLDALTYAANQDFISELNNYDRYSFIEGDICDSRLLDEIFTNHHIAGVIHFAAESHVDNSIDGPEAFVQTNVLGTFHLLETAKKHWLEAPFSTKNGYENNRFLHISTDEVYGSLGAEGLFTENTPYAPNSPYSASKASSDMLVRSYYHTYGLNVVTTNCSNNYGHNQHDEKLIPTIIRKALYNEPIPIYGDGMNIRDWLYVEDHCRGIDLAFHQGRSGETYNIGGNNERTNLKIAHTICEILDRKAPKSEPYKKLITFVKDRPGHDLRYAIDASKITKELGWQAIENFETGIEKTIDYYLKKYKN